MAHDKPRWAKLRSVLPSKTVVLVSATCWAALANRDRVVPCRLNNVRQWVRVVLQDVPVRLHRRLGIDLLPSSSVKWWQLRLSRYNPVPVLVTPVLRMVTPAREALTLERSILPEFPILSRVVLVLPIPTRHLWPLSTSSALFRRIHRRLPKCILPTQLEVWTPSGSMHRLTKVLPATLQRTHP